MSTIVNAILTSPKLGVLLFDGNRIEFSTGYRIYADKWDTSKQRVKPKYTNKQKVSAADINATLSNYELVILDVFKDFEV